MCSKFELLINLSYAMMHLSPYLMQYKKQCLENTKQQKKKGLLLEYIEQAEAEVVPSSSLVEIEVEVEVGVEVEKLGLRLELRLRLELD